MKLSDISNNGLPMSSVHIRQSDNSVWDVRFQLEDAILPNHADDLYDLHEITDITHDATREDQLIQHVRFRVSAATTDVVLRIVKQARWILTYHV